MANAGNDSYVLGRSASETRRLQAQEKIFGPYTEQFLRMAGIGPGMRILDVGSGAGDVALAAARITGASGRVTGVDADAEILSTARRRAADAGFPNVSFTHASLPELPLEGGFDAVTGRFILIHLDDPAAALRAVSTLVRPGGLVAFQEYITSCMRAVPQLPLLEKCTEWLSAGLRAGGRDPDLGRELVAIFREAGLPLPAVNVAVHATSDRPICDLVGESITSLLPLIERSGAGTREEIGSGTLAERIWEQMTAAGAAILAPALAGAWTRIP